MNTQRIALAAAVIAGSSLLLYKLLNFSSTVGAKFLSPPKLSFSKEVFAYAAEKGIREHPQMVALRNVTATHARARMMAAPEEANFFILLLKAIQAKKVIEIGVFTGYTTLALALGLPEDGKVVALDVSSEYAAIGQPFWEKAGVTNKIQLKIAPATESLAQLLKEGETESFDFIFIDADKVNYVNYYQAAISLLRKGGILAIDNVLWSGRVANPRNNEPDTVALRKLNDMIKEDKRVEIAMLTIADGVTLVRKL